jgi:hypothetical protein
VELTTHLCLVSRLRNACSCTSTSPIRLHSLVLRHRDSFTFTLLTWSRILENLIVAHLVKKFLAFYGIRKFTNKSTPLDPILSQLYPIHSLTSCIFKVQFNIRPILASTFYNKYLSHFKYMGQTYTHICIHRSLLYKYKIFSKT